MLRFLAIFLLLCAQLGVFGQIAPQAKLANRQVFIQEVYRKVEGADLSDPKQVKHLLWATSAFKIQTPKVLELIGKLVESFQELDAKNRYSLILNVGGSCYPSKVSLLLAMLKTEVDVKNRLALLYYLDKVEMVEDKLASSSDWGEVARAIRSRSYLNELATTDVRIQLAYTLSLFPDCYHIVALVRSNRDIPAKLYLVESGKVDAEGPFQYLARSATNAIPYLSNGNTPAGIFKVGQPSVSDNLFIGPTPTLETFLPFEVPISSWGLMGSEWNATAYEALLHPSLRNNAMLWQSYYAGKLGRGEIIVHGSTIDPTFFVGTPYHPLTPSLGCLSALELWDLTSGKLRQSSQLELINTVLRSTLKPGLLLVLQVDEQTYSSSFSELLR